MTGIELISFDDYVTCASRVHSFEWCVSHAMSMRNECMEWSWRNNKTIFHYFLLLTWLGVWEVYEIKWIVKQVCSLQADVSCKA